MPKKARKAIGGPRPKKKKVQEAETVEEEPDDEDEDEEAEEAPPPPPPEAAVPPAEPSPPALVTAPVPSLLEMVGAELQSAMHKLDVVNRRWKKTIDTYFNDDGGFLWREDSVVERNLARLNAMDEEHDRAEDFARYKLKEYQMMKNWHILCRAARKFPRRPSYARQRDLARHRLLEHRMSIVRGEHRQPRPGRNLPVEEQVAVLIREVGLAKAIQWVHVRDLRQSSYWSN